MTIKSEGSGSVPACPYGHYVHYDNPTPTVLGLVEGPDNKFLLLKRAHEPFAGQWDCPSGFIEPEETAEQALAREIHEETGAEAYLVRFIGSFPSRYGEGGKPTLGFAYHCRVSQRDVAVSEESSEAGWWDLADLPDPAFADERAAVAAFRQL